MAAAAATACDAYAEYGREAERVMGHDFAARLLVEALGAGLRKESVLVDVSGRRVGVSSTLTFFMRQWLADFPDERILVFASGYRAATELKAAVNNPDRVVVLPMGQQRFSWRIVGRFTMVVVPDVQFAPLHFNSVLARLLNTPDLPVILVRLAASNYYVLPSYDAIKNHVQIEPTAVAEAQ